MSAAECAACAEPIRATDPTVAGVHSWCVLPEALATYTAAAAARSAARARSGAPKPWEPGYRVTHPYRRARPSGKDRARTTPLPGRVVWEARSGGTCSGCGVRFPRGYLITHTTAGYTCADAVCLARSMRDATPDQRAAAVRRLANA